MSQGKPRDLRKGKRTVVPTPDLSATVSHLWSEPPGPHRQVSRHRQPDAFSWHGQALSLASIGLHTNGKAGARTRAGTQSARNAAGHRLSCLSI
jgi:hypothetical protein